MDLRSKNSCRKNGPTIGKRIRNILRGRLKLCSFHSNGFASIHSGPSLSLSPRGVRQDGSSAVPDARHHLHLESSIHTAEKQCVITLFVSDLLTATGVSYAVYEQQMGFPPFPQQQRDCPSKRTNLFHLANGNAPVANWYTEQP